MGLVSGTSRHNTTSKEAYLAASLHTSDHNTATNKSGDNYMFELSPRSRSLIFTGKPPSQLLFAGNIKIRGLDAYVGALYHPGSDRSKLTGDTVLLLASPFTTRRSPSPDMAVGRGQVDQ